MKLKRAKGAQGSHTYLKSILLSMVRAVMIRDSDPEFVDGETVRCGENFEMMEWCAFGGEPVLKRWSSSCELIRPVVFSVSAAVPAPQLHM